MSYVAEVTQNYQGFFKFLRHSIVHDLWKPLLITQHGVSTDLESYGQQYALMISQYHYGNIESL